MPRVSARPIRRIGAQPPTSGPITAARYVDPDWLTLEDSHVWPTQWLFAGMASDVAEPGQYLVFDIARESIVVARTDDGTLAASFNACQHRGARVVTTPRGCTQRFVCPYHGWTYRPDGSLAVVPDHERFDGGVDRTTRSLRPVRVAERHGVVWVSMSEDGPDIDDFLGAVGDRLAGYHLERFRLVGDQTVALDCNWKAVMDNFGELYHVEHIHPQHQTLFDCPTALVELFERGHTCVTIDGHTVNTRLPIPPEPTPFLTQELRTVGLDPTAFEGRVLEIRAAYQRRRRELAPGFGFDDGALSDERLSDIEQYNVFPNVIITVQPDDALVLRPRPHPTDPDRCWMDKLTLVRVPDPAVAEHAGVPFEPPKRFLDLPCERPDHDAFDHDDIIEGRKTMTITIDQDIHLLRDIQAGMHSRGFVDQRLSTEEARIAHHHDTLLALVGRPHA